MCKTDCPPREDQGAAFAHSTADRPIQLPKELQCAADGSVCQQRVVDVPRTTGMTTTPVPGTRLFGVKPKQVRSVSRDNWAARSEVSQLTVSVAAGRNAVS